jgi:hypothetical protein
MVLTAGEALTNVPDLLAHLARFETTRELAVSLAGAIELQSRGAETPTPTR